MIFGYKYQENSWNILILFLLHNYVNLCDILFGSLHSWILVW